MKVNFIFRKPNKLYFSIEKVFETIIANLPAEVHAYRSFAVSERANLQSLLRNLMHSNKNADIYHVTGDVHYMALAYPWRRTILTVHDCIFMENSAGVKQKLIQWLWLKLPVRGSKMVTVISQATKQDVIKYTGCDPNKVVIIPDPVSEKFHFAPASFNTARPRILQVGTWPNKNLDRVIAALTGLPVELAIIGKLTDVQRRLLHEAAIKFDHLYNLTEEELAEEYRKSDVLVFASTFEGFGLPIVEAQATGRVVVTSDLLPMSEVAGGAAILVDPHDINSIRNGIEQAINDEHLRNELIRKGLQNVKRFTPTNVASQYYQLYRDLLNNN